MEPKEYAEAVQQMILDAEDRLTGAVRKHQRRILAAIRSELGKLSYKNGRTAVTASNRQRIRAIQRAINNVIASPLFAADLESFVRAFAKVEGISLDYFKGVFDGFQANEQYEAIRLAAIDEIRSGFQAGINQALRNPVTAILQQAYKGATRRELEDLFARTLTTQVNPSNRSEIVKAGEFERFTGRYVRDSLNQYSRVLNEAASINHEAEWFLYSGTIVGGTRPFCKEKANKYFHIEEIYSWEKQKWQGKHPQTNRATIFKYLGGYNCLHELIPVPISMVPKSVVERNAKKGFYKQVA